VGIEQAAVPTSSNGEWLTPQNTAIPVLPALAGRISEVARDPDLSLVQLANLIGKDQVLASRLLQLANSTYGAPMQKVGTIREAVLRVGADGVRDMVATVCFSSRMYDPRIYGDLGRLAIEHSIGTAYVARMVAEKAGEDEDAAFLCGLLHDIGKLLILKLAFDYRQRTGAVVPSEVVAAAIEHDHANVGAVTLKRWGLPASLEEPIRCHHDCKAATSNPREVMVAYVANRLSHRYGFGCDPDVYNIVGDPAFRELGLDAAWLSGNDGRAQGLFEVARQAPFDAI
jgi:putative nucleotidyltransferase with HDIG domain